MKYMIWFKYNEMDTERKYLRNVCLHNYGDIGSFRNAFIKNKFYYDILER